ncbi:MAG: protein phosphatase 2C domain-containing protein [Coleofasciculaceae cyanobacterium]
MENPTAMLHCPNISCQAPNAQRNRFCEKCQTPMLRRYLWAIGSGLEAYQPGTVIHDRYVLVRQAVVLDTKPAISPETPQEIPQSLLPYLRLSPYQLHIPQLYGQLVLPNGQDQSLIWLLEEAPIYLDSPERQDSEPEGQLLPELGSVWKDAPAMRQLNWLWQIASLWQPLSVEGVAASLLTPELLRVEGPLVRLLELQPNTKTTPTLKQLGQLWSQWLVGASPPIAKFLENICTQLKKKQIKTSEQLIAQLDQKLFECGRSQLRRYNIFTGTDSGPARSHNEDACYPPSGQQNPYSADSEALAIVCDGIGGHEGGEVASQLAIDKLRELVVPLQGKSHNPTDITLELENAVCAANDLISHRNDIEQRSERQRMGTTLVMTQTHAHEVYITHVGDSRVYRVTRHNCHQLTQDDDLASREVRLGYCLYRNAIQQPTSGSLVQALGMASSSTLHPTVQRLILDEDCVFLLCSDGLSDNDRVEQYWQTEILPILERQVDVKTAAERLVEIANRKNGHDNVTVALLHCQVASISEDGQTELSVPQPSRVTIAPTTSAPVTDASTASTKMETQLLPTARAARTPWGLLLGIFCLLLLGGAISYLLMPGVSRVVDPLVGLAPESDSEQEDIITGVPKAASPSPPASSTAETSDVSALEPPTQIQIVSSANTNPDGSKTPLLLRRTPPPENQSQPVVGIVPAGSVLQIIAKEDTQQDIWLKLQVCAPGNNSSQTKPPSPRPTPTASPEKLALPSPQPVKRGNEGWIKETEIRPFIDPNFAQTSGQPSQCVPSTPSSPPTE